MVPEVLRYQFFSVKVIIGGGQNSWTTIARLGNHTAKVLANSTTPGVHDCSSVKALWVAWGDGAISVGRGAIVHRRSLATSDTGDPLYVSSISIASAEGTYANWVFGHLDSKDI